MELERSVDKFREQGLGVAAISYDSQEVDEEEGGGERKLSGRAPSGRSSQTLWNGSTLENNVEIHSPCRCGNRRIDVLVEKKSQGSIGGTSRGR